MVNDAPKLFVKCKTCGIEYWSAIRCGKQRFKHLDFGGNRIRCPNGHMDRYAMEDFYFKE